MDSPSGKTTALLMMNGTAEAATSMTVTPLTVCVNIRCREARRRVRTYWIRVETTSRLASRPGPPACSAKAQTVRNGTLKLVTMRRPEPRCRNRRLCRIMLTPETASTVNVTQDR